MTTEELFVGNGGVRLVRGGESVWNFGAPHFAGMTELRPEWQPNRLLEAVAPGLFKGDDDAPVFLWEAESKVLGRLLPSWDQGQVGSCVSHGCGRAAQDLALWEIACGEAEEWPAEVRSRDDGGVCREAIYGGSRVEVGGGRLSGDGSIGEWAGKWLKDWGVLLYTKYGGTDLTGGYSESRCRSWGNSGCPNDLEPIAKQHPVTDVAKVTTADAAWAALGAGKPIQICSGVGFTTQRDRDGFCSPSGSWAHCMEIRARFRHPSKGRCFVIQNSWADYLGTSNMEFQFVAADGSTKTGRLPNGGAFCVVESSVARIVRENDSDAYAGFSGWKRTRIDYTP